MIPSRMVETPGADVATVQVRAPRRNAACRIAPLTKKLLHIMYLFPVRELLEPPNESE